MQKGLLRLLEAVEIPESHLSYPWKRLNYRDSPKLVDHYALAATLAFANKRLRKNHANTELVNQALEELSRHQGEDGGWQCWADDPSESIDATAMIVHALALNRPRGWEMSVSGACDWLLKRQDRTGCWYEDTAPFEVYLTVLVLDALALRQSNSSLTFRLSTSTGLIGKKRSRSNKIGVLFLAANPRDTNSLSLDEQIRLIDQKIRSSEFRDCIELKSAWAVRADDLLQALNNHRPHVVHFSGHGSDSGNIVVVGKHGNAHPISTKALKALFRTLKDNCRIVILDACYSKAQAHALIRIVDCAIGMDGTIGQAAATMFTASFYRAVGSGRSIQEAFDQGIASLLLENIPEEHTPKLFVKKGVNARMLYLLDISS